MTTAVIADDERLARVALLSLLAGHPEIEVVGEADSVSATVTELERLNPELLFLDIQMPDGFGFEVFERTEVTCPVIFVTAYDAHALRAFEVNALDYLLKPVEPERLRQALERAGRSETPALRTNQERYAPGDLICLSQGRSMKFARVEEIVALFAADDYVEVLLASGYRALVPERLRDWQRRLPERFVQIHRSTLVNLHFVDEIEQIGKQWVVRLRNQAPPLTMSRRFAQALRRNFQPG